MKILLLGLCLLLTACPATVTRIPDTSETSQHVGKIGIAATSAQQSAGKIDSNLHDLRTNADRLDAKSVVVLRWLNK